MMFKYLALVGVAVFAQDATTTPDSTATPVPISSETFKQRPGVCNAGGKECAAYGTGSDYQCVAVESTIPSLNNLAQCVKKVDQQGSNICVGSQAGVCPTFGSWPATYRAAQPVCAFTVVPTCTSAQTSNGNFVSVRELQSATTTKKPSGVECYLNNYLLANGSTTQIKGIYKCVDITFYRSKALGLDQTEKQLKACAGNSSTGFTAGLCNGHGTCSPKSQYSSEYECKCNRGYSNQDNCFAATENVCDGLGQCGGLGQCDSATNKCKCKDGAKGDQCALCDPASAAACSGSNQGSCGVDGKCVCKTGYGGSQCEVKSAPTPAPTTTPAPTQAGGSTPSGSASTVFASLAAVALAVVLAQSVFSEGNWGCRGFKVNIMKMHFPFSSRSQQVMLRTVQAFIHGRHVTGRGVARTLLDPHNRTPITQFNDVDAQQVAEAVKSAKEAQPLWAKMTPASRGAILRRAAAILTQETEKVQMLECIDTGRVLAEMEADILSATDCLEHFAGIAPTLGGQMLDIHSPNWAYTRREPIGITAGIGAWNYPLQSAAWKSAPALAFGNAMIFKPSEETPLSAVRLAEIYVEAGVPPGVFNVVIGGGEVGSALVSHPSVRKVSFTGSVPTGRKVYSTCAEQIKPATMELGGKSALIVFSDTDLHEAVSGAMLANWYSNGQVCSNGTRVFVHESIHDAFVDLLVKRTAALKIGPPLHADSQVGPMITTTHLDKVRSYIQIGIDEGATLAYGGTTPPDLTQGNYILPAIFTNCHDDMRIVQEEIFGMVACILPFRDEDEVISRANASPFGLSAGVFTNDMRRAHRVVHQLQVGTSWINTYNIAPVELPWGGVKASGIGRENGVAAAHAWTQLKSVYVEMDSVVPCPYA